MSAHVFVDEAKDRGYFVTAAALVAGDVSQARKTISGLIKPRQRRLHFSAESDARRKQILDALGELGAQCTVYDGSQQPRKRQRDACLLQLVDDLAISRAQLLVLERDDSVVEVDKKLLYRRTREVGCQDTLTYRHQRAHEEPLLALPDAIAWCVNRGGIWKQRAQPLITATHTV